jgi:predicted DNA-binding WGR domain protein
MHEPNENVCYQTSFNLNELNTDENLSHNFHLTPAPLAINKIAETNEVYTAKVGEANLLVEVTAHLAHPNAFAYYCFAKDNPTQNCQHHYSITYQPSLWNDYTIFRQWGRSGSEHLFSRTEHYVQATPAQKRVQRLVRRRLRRGYHLSFAA